MLNVEKVSGVTLLALEIEFVAQQLLEETLSTSWGELSPSLYDTAYALFLPLALQPKGSLEFILSNQKDDGNWGGPDAYCIVPTLAATAGLLHLTLKAAFGEEIAGNQEQIALAAKRGLSFLASILTQTTVFPDTVAVELLVPALVEKIETTLVALADVKSDCIGQTEIFREYIRECTSITLPPQDMKHLTKLRQAARLGEEIPMKLFHTLEIFGDDLDYVNNVYDVDGVYGGSPASTIAILNASPTSQERSISFLSEIAARYDGRFPVATIEIFERAWILYNFIQSGIPIPDDMARRARDYFQSFLGSQGIGFAPKMSPDADDTAVVLYVLGKLGYPVEPESLLNYETETHFLCYDGERTPSPSTNAHILEAFGSYIKLHPESILDYKWAMAKISTYLLCVQKEDGSWIDKWHASPYYATNCSVLALHSFGIGNTTEAIDRAIAWLLRTQREDGSWGIWHGTLDETACALQMLLLAGWDKDNVNLKQAALKGQHFLIVHQNAPPTDPARTHLWHEKDLFEPIRIVRSQVLSALHLCAVVMK